ncbi:MAG: dTMP kinase [Maritimibacter sp.]
MAGLFITFEGIDGSGKSTQSRLLADTLAAEGHEVLHTREPGGSPGAEEIRRLVLEGDPERWSAETEILLFTAARRDHLERVIEPSLEAGKLVICDRFADSTRMYQGLRSPGLRAVVDKLHSLMIGRDELQAQMRAGFLALAEEYDNRCVVIDGDREIEAVASDVAQVARERLR